MVDLGERTTRGFLSCSRRGGGMWRLRVIISCPCSRRGVRGFGLGVLGRICGRVVCLGEGCGVGICDEFWLIGRDERVWGGQV